VTAATGLAGLGCGLGLALVVHGWPQGRRIPLEDRVAPYVAAVASGVRTETAPWTRRLVGRVDRFLGGQQSVRRRLERAGSVQTVEQVRLEQLIWAACAFGAAMLVVGLRARAGGVPLVPALVLCCCAAVAGGAARDVALTRAAERREARLVAEFPAIAELLALAVSAGEGALGAVVRVARTCTGEFAVELDRVLGETRTGGGFAESLDAMARRLDIGSVSRFVAGVVTALERGTPLADVLRAQAADARDADRRRLMDAAGKREIAMLVPVVFLVLPVTVVFALFPGLYGLDLAA
jgi:tight adherence protein C